jgi:5,5'-dehydrodivanillate O-demethylase
MMPKDENELLTRVGPGTPMGALMRRYWQPVAATEEMDDRWTKRIRVLGEDLVMFKDENGGFGLIAETCPHRRVSLAFGIPTENGIRCAYHGWAFDKTGRCVDQPNEGPRHALRDKIATTAYPVEEMGGLLWAYLGPAPVPLLPRFDGFVVDKAIRTIASADIPCNWLQVMENSVDPVHVETLHGRVSEFHGKQKGIKHLALAKRHVKIAFDEFEYGIIKRRLLEGQPEDSQDWTVGHPLVFPLMVAIGTMGTLWQQYSFEIRVPIDDTNTKHYWYNAFLPPAGSIVPEHLLTRTNWYEQPYRDKNGEYLMEFVPAQDVAMWITQGPIASRDKESLGQSDVGVVQYRRMLKREVEKVARGEDPLGTVRDPAKNQMIVLPIEAGKYMNLDGFRRLMVTNMIYSPIVNDLLKVFEGADAPELETADA